MKLKVIKQNKNSQPWLQIPKWLLPIVIIFIVAFIYFVAQYAASILLSIYALIRGWNAIHANNWLTNSVFGQFIYVLLFEVIAIGFLYTLLKRYSKSLVDIGLNKFKIKYGGYALMAYPAYLIIYIILLSVVKHFYLSLQVNQNQQIGFNSVHGGFQLVITFFSLVVLPPIAEELLFRGFLFEGLKKSMNWIYAGILTSALFAVAHLPEGGSSGLFWIGAIDVFVLSMVLVYLKQKTKSLWPGIILHAIKNLVAFVSLFLLTNR